MYRWFGRIWILMLILLWALAGAQLLEEQNRTKEEEVSEVFASMDSVPKDGIVEYYGQIKQEKHILLMEEREAYLRSVAEKLGICDHILISRTYGEDNQTTVLEKKGANGDTTLRLTTWRKDGEIEKQTLLAHITLKDDLNMAMRVRRKLKATADGDMKKTRSCVGVALKYDGKISLKKRNAISDHLLVKLDAAVVSEQRNTQVYTICARTPWIRESVRQDGENMNVNIVSYYNRTENTTYLYAAVPIMGVDY